MKVFAAIRKSADDGHEWIDTSTITYLSELSLVLAKDTDAEIPHYAKDNQLIRIGQFNLVEVEA